MRSAARYVVGGVVLLHGAVHLLGVAEGWGLADVEALSRPVSRAEGALWLLAALLVAAAAVTLMLDVYRWWVVAAGAAVVSEAAIATSWGDAWAGTALNVLLLLVAVHGYAVEGPGSFHAEYSRRAATALGSHAPGRPVTDSDLAALPGPLADYLRRGGAVGRPRVGSFRAVLHGRIRSAPDAPWMSFTAEQVNTGGVAPSRLFHMDATLHGLPVDVLHVYADGSSNMRARVLSLFTMVDSSGPEMLRGETVTVFNDLCLLAPPALLDAPVTWQQLDERRVRGVYTAFGETVSAELRFDDQARLVDFVSDDRLRASADGTSFTRLRWSTPSTGFGAPGSEPVVVSGEARWHAPPPEGEFTYAEVRVDRVETDPGAPAATRHRRLTPARAR